MPASAVGALGEASYTVTANVTDSAGNSNSASHNVQVNTALPGVTINPVATDDIINAAESGNAQTISGQVTGAAAGDTVTVTLGGKTYTATVQGNLSWSVDVPAADIQAIGNGNLTVNASVTNGVGNTGSGSRDITIDANLPGLRVDTVAGDDVVNSIEHAQALVITGSSSGLAAGAALTVVINTVTYAATVLADGTWSVGVPAADVSNWPAGTVNITVSGTNTAGTTSTITHPVTVDLAAVAISINTVSGDDVINAAEKGADLTLSGSTSGVEVGQTVTVTFGGKTYTATVAGDGSWTTTVPAADLSVLRDGDATVQASVSTINGNTASATHAYSVDATAPTLAINTIATDDILNAAEAGNPLTISGSSTAEAGQTVTVTLNGVTYSGSVQADGSWSVSLPTADLSNLTASQYTVSASVSDKAGNPASANHGLAVDLTVPVLTINTVSGDDIINAAEHGQALVISGSSTGGEAGDVITVTLNSKTYTTMLDASGNWSVGVPAADVTALGSGPQTITAAITDAAGNSDDASRTVTVNLAAPTIGINTIATDDVIKATEKGADLQITGTSNQPAGTTITVTLNGQNYTATTDSNGNWSATVPASAVSALGEANYTVTANVTDTAGNSNSASHNVLVNSALPAVTINAVATDDIINAAESGNAQTISGQVTGAAQGDTVTVTLGGNTYTATVQSNLSWSVDVPAADIQALGNGDLTVNASVTNGVGNTGSGSRDITIDANLPSLRVDTVAGDDVINSIEHNQALVITGSSSGLTAGTALTVEINNVTYGATVLADGTWSLGVPAVDVSNWPAGTVNITVSGTNSAGTTSTITHPVTVDLAGVAITINTLSGDDVINAVEKGETLVVSGSTSGVEAGQTVTVTFGGKNYTTTVEANGSWTVNVPPADLAALPDGAGNVQASVSNINGNSAQADRAYSVDATAPLVTINTIASDDILNVSEAGAGITISGTTTAQAGQTLTVTLNNNTYQTTVLADGTWSVNVPAADLSGLTASSYTVTATVSDKAGNPASADHALVVDITAPDLTINTVAGDDIINAIEHGQALVVSGTSTGAAAGDVVTVTLNGKNYTTTLDASGNWSVGIPAADVTALATGSQTITASLSDRAGNSDSTTHDVTVDLSGPTLTINTVSGDDIINAAEIVVAQTISGQVTGTAVAGNTVIVTIGGNQYNATVQSDLSWSVSVPANVLQALGNGELTISASLTNSANNTGTATHDIVIDANLPGLRVDTVAGDDVINSIEHTQALVITGSSSGLAAGAALTVVINSVTYGATVLADGSWSVGVPVADVTNWPAGTVNIAVSGTNTAGTTTSISHPVTVDLAAVAITINTLSTDDVINAAEKGSDLQLSGTTSGVEAGQTITVIFGGKSYTTTVAADNTWGLTIPAVDVATLPDGAANVQASVSNVAGNSTQATHAYSVDATAPSVTINTIATDDILNAAEAGSALTISGTSTAEAGQTVTVTLNGVNYSGNVQADGSWSVSVPTGDLASLTASSYTVNASVSDKARNSASATHNLTVDLAAPVVTINTVAGDDIINATEHGQAQIISGSATGATTGNTVSVTIGTTTYTTVLDANGNWSIGVPASVISALAQGDVTITATVTDSAGNSGTASHTVTVALGAPVLAINTIAVDDIINAAEKGADLAITGTSNQPAGTQITVTLNGQNYTTTADASGNWSVTVPASRVSALGEATYTVTAAATDADGNSGSASHNVQVNTALPGVTINVVATDDIINAAEAGVEQTISGQVTGAAAGDTVTVTLGGATYTATVQANLSWSVDVPASALQELGNGELTISASVTNSVGNTGNGTREITIDANLPGLRVDTVAGDDVVNIIEHGQALVITGSSSGLAAGSNVTLTINGQTYVAAVLADGTWSVGVPAVDVSAWPAGSVTIAASGSTSAGNPVSVTHPVTVDLSAVAVSINAITADDVINAAEKGAALTLSGSTSGVEAGQTVTVTFGGKTYSATVAANGSWSTSVPAADMAALRDGDASAQASVSNVNGNSATTTHAYSVDASAPTVTINTIAGDDILNAAEAGAALTITGSSTAEAGQTVTVTLNGTNYTGTVQTDGSWSVSVPSADLSTLTASNYTVNAAVSDKAGNPASVNHNLTVDTSVPVVTINTVAGDDVINATEHAQAQIISGSATGAATGSTVTVTIGTNTFTTVLDASGNWSVGVPASVVSALANGTVTINASVTDAGGNSGSATHQVTVNTGLPTITFNAISGDNILNADEKGQPLTISGGSTGLATGAQVTVTLNGHNYSATTDASGNWTLTVPVSDLAALGQANYTVSASATSAAGNTASSQANLLVDSGLPDVTINTVAGDDIINAAEAGADQTISGVVTRAAAGDTVTVTLGGNTYTATVQSNLSWSVSVPTADLQALGNGDLTITASVTNANGNTGSGTRDITIDANLPGLRVDTVAGDDIVNSIEHGQALVITGGSSGLNAGAVLTVTINSVAYSATVQADGSWSVGIPAANVSAWPAGPLTVEVDGQSSANNPVSVSHPFTVDLTAVAISINTVASDDVINAAEKGTNLTLSGSTSGIESGQTVTVTFGGKTYTASVAANGSWSVNVPAADLATLPEGAANVQASVSSASGNSASATHAYSVDASAPTLTINTIASDDILNAAEAGSPLTISGTSTAETGQTVTVTLNGATYTGTVQADGSWSVSVPTSALGALNASNYTVSATVNDKAGNPGSASHNLAVDTTAPVLTINTVAGDDIINDAEHAQALVISGTSSGGEAGDVVSVVLNGKTYTTTVAANGSWSTTVPAADLAALRDGDASAQVRVTNVNGNSATATHEYSVDSAAPTVTINTIASDNIINASEAAAGVTVSGTSTAQTGQTLTVTLNGTNYQTTVQTDGSWSLTLPASDLTALANNGYTLTATVSDLAGNLGSASKGVTVDTTAPVISFNTVAGDDVINNVEHIQAQIISGTATGAVAGDRLVVTIAGQQYVTSTDASGNWSVGVPASVISGLADGTVTISATITDSAGNSSTQTHNVQVNTAAVSLSVSTISGDNLINAAEAGSALTLSGTGTNFATGTVVTVLLNGKGYSATIQSNGSWSVNVPAADVAALSDGTSYTVSASAQDSAGNSATASRSVAVDLTAPVISINTVSTDDRLNAAEQQQPLTLNGSTSAEVGQTVTVTFGGKTYTATVAANGTWALNVPAVDLAALGQGAQTITASVNDRAGNPGQATHALTVDTVAPTVTIATVAGDDIINNAEQLAGQTISGTTTAEVGQTVTVTFNGQTWSATVGSGGSWSVFIPAQQFAGLSDGSYTISATVSDQAGNPGSASRGVTLNGDVPTVTINTFAGDDVVNAAEHGSSLVISGTTTAPVGQTLTLTLNGKTYTTTVQTGGSWSYTLGSADVTALADGNAYVINASVSNAIGNTGSSNHTITVDLSAPAMGINIDSLQADTGLSASDFITSVSPVVVNGSLTAALASNETAQISIDGGTTWTTLTVTGTTWRYNDSRTLTDGNYLYQVRVIDAAGNVGATDSQNVVIDTTAPDPAVKTIAISAITTDMGLITNDFVTSDTTLAVSGTLGATLSAGEFAQISLDGGVTWTTLTVVGTSWSYADGHTLTDGTWNYTVRVVDLAGNVGQTATQNVVVDTTSPEAAKSITITGISDDTGTSSSDFITSDTTLTVRGVLGAALGANEFAQISTDNGATWVNVTVAADSLNWSYVDGRTLTNGTTTWQVRVVDLAGNVGATSSQSALIDTVNPAQVLTIASISTDTGSSATDFITSDTMLTLTGSLGAGLASGEVAQISLDSGATWTTLTTNGTQWTYTDSRTLTDGSYVYQVRVLDLAGNTGPVVSKTVVVDTINPTATPTIVSYTDDVGQRQGTLSSSQATDDTTPLLNGVLSAPLASGEVVYLYRNGLLLGAVTMVGALNWTYSDSGLVSGAYTYSARVVDLAGNITSSSDFVLTVDTSIPTTLAQITSQTTRDTTPIISGVITAALASGQYVEVVINGKTYTSEPGGAVVVDPAHNTWYVQLPDTDALTVSATAYTVTAQVKSSAGNGNNANISNGTVTVNAAIDYTPTWTTASKTTAWGLTYGLDSHGMWTVLANQQVMQSTDPLTWSKTALTLYQSGNNYATSSIADYDRNGTGDLFITRDDYGTGYINGFTNNGDGTFSSAIQVTVGTLTWYGSIVAFDKEGDGYLDFWIGDAGGPDSNTFLWNNAGTLVGNSTTSNSGGSATVGGAVTGYLSLNEGSGVDLNNDGRIDLVQHTYNLNNYYTLSSLINQGNGTFVWGQNTTNTFLSGAGSGAMSSSVSMTWADFDGDGDMDLFLPASQGRANYGSLLFNTNGVLGSPVAVGATATTYASQFSLAVDWNHDGLMDIARIAQTGQSYLYTNVSNASNWTQSALGGSQSGTTSGVAAMDYDWDGAVDVLVSKQSGSVFLSRNTNTVSYGTSLHLRITDPNGINVYYGNTVKLYNSAGVLVATQIINPQSGMGVNDTSALVNFYGLNAGETYNAVLIKSTGTTASNIDQTVNTSWGGLQATDATHAYDLSAEAGTASNNGKFVGTGYNDTFFATAGTDTYDGSGGWVYSSGTGTWLANGGMDVVDFRLSTVGVTANLSSTAAQATGFNTSTFTNIEGISGSNFNDILTGSSGDNQLEGRGGNDTLNIGNGGHDTLLYKLLNASDATGGNGSDVVNGFTVGTWEGTADTDRIDIRELLQGSGYTGNGKASYVNGVATLDAQAGNIGDFVKVTQSGSDTIVQIDRDGTGGTFATTNVVTLTGVHTDLATLLANHQLMVV
ncbi:Ig-like domain-containing protein [Escherichia coli]|nr:Ig-like domain-containing protein [Escherichia coli]EEY8440836.1 Ig-like domain-containing protein [Escherichia coli]EFD2354609.1 Ig-like domain-containing protein [Escherichia coli]EFG3441837.1 Ig-like domain-containing protein [Escherichia coli]EFG7801469.1 Ig-like domain-containing protein [Escherichia coli]